MSPSWSGSRARAGSRTTASEWWRANVSCRRPATSSWAGIGSPTRTEPAMTTTSASSAIGRARWRSIPCDPAGLEIYARLCGWTLARAHARSGDRVAIAAYLGKSEAFDHAIAEFSVSYADQNQRDYEALQAAIKHGKIEAEAGV